MTAEETEALREEIARRYGSVHKFCRRHRARLNRATVYMVLAGSYGGNAERQARRIRDVLTGARSERELAMQAIKDVACARCSVKARPCTRCDGMFQAQASAVMRILSLGEQE